MFCDWVSYPTMKTEAYTTSYLTGVVDGCPSFSVSVSGMTEDEKEALSEAESAWTDGYAVTVVFTQRTWSLPDGEGTFAYCFGNAMERASAPNGAYCLTFDTLEVDSTGENSTAGSTPVLTFVPSETWASNSFAGTVISDSKYALSITPTIAENDTDIYA